MARDVVVVVVNAVLLLACMWVVLWLCSCSVENPLPLVVVVVLERVFKQDAVGELSWLLTKDVAWYWSVYVSSECVL